MSTMVQDLAATAAMPVQKGEKDESIPITPLKKIRRRKTSWKIKKYQGRRKMRRRWEWGRA